MFRRGDESEESEGSQPDEQVKVVEASIIPRQDEPASDDDEGGGMFGNLMDLPEAGAEAASEQDDSQGKTIKLREFRLPKHLPSAFTLPKKLLTDLLYSNTRTRASTSGTVTPNQDTGRLRDVPPRMTVSRLVYSDISGGSKAKRVKLEIEWSPDLGPGFQAKTVNAKAGNKAPKKKPSPVEGTTSTNSNPQVEQSGGTNAVSSSETAPATSSTEPAGLDKTLTQPVSAAPDYTYKLLMESTACTTLVEAENFLSLVLLHEVTTGTPHSAMLRTLSKDLGVALPKPPPVAKPPASSDAAKSNTTMDPDQKGHIKNDTEVPVDQKKEAQAGGIPVPEPASATPGPDSKDNESKDPPPPSPLDVSLPPWLPEYPPIKPQNLPLAYRDAWDELENIRKEQQNMKDRRVWRVVDGLFTGEEEGQSTEPKGTKISPSAANTNANRGNATAAAQSDVKQRQGGRTETHNAINGSSEPDQRILTAWEKRSTSSAYKDMLVSSNCPMPTNV